VIGHIKVIQLYIMLGMFLLGGCAQDMGYYVNLPAQSTCKIVTISPNRTGIDHGIYNRLVAWAQKELPSLGYMIVDPTAKDAPSTCGEVVAHYSSQVLPTHETSAASTDSKTCINTPAPP
jgi:hypothetical protein